MRIVHQERCKRAVEGNGPYRAAKRAMFPNGCTRFFQSSTFNSYGPCPTFNIQLSTFNPALQRGYRDCSRMRFMPFFRQASIAPVM